MKTKHIAGASIGLIALATNTRAGIVGYEKYTYDAAGNIVEKQIDGHITRLDYHGNTLRATNQGTSYGHDDAGRLMGEFREGRPERNLAYQFGDKVTKVKEGSATTELFYNSEGHLVGKNASGQTETFAWDSLGLVMRKDQVFANEEHMVGGVPAIACDEVIVSDYLGSTLTLGANGVKSTAFGEGLEEGLFTGKPYVNALGKFVYQHRCYSPEVGRWSTPDPSGYPDGRNNFEHVSGDPLSRYDALGLSDNDIGDPLQDPMYASAGWDRYNQFWQADADTGWYSYPGFTAGSSKVEVRVKYEYRRNETGPSYSIPQNSSIVVSSTVGTTYTLQGGLTIYSAVSFSASAAANQSASLTKTIDAYAKGDVPRAYDYLSTAQIRGEKVYQNVQHRYTNSQGNVGSWGSYYHQPTTGQISSGWRGWTDDILGIAEKKEL